MLFEGLHKRYEKSYISTVYLIYLVSSGRAAVRLSGVWGRVTLLRWLDGGAKVYQGCLRGDSGLGGLVKHH